MRSVMETLAITLPHEEAALALEGMLSVFVVFSPDDMIMKYKGRMVIHTMPIPDEANLQQDLMKLLSELGTNLLEFPGLALQGWVEVKKIAPYSAADFKKDFEDGKHIYGQGDLRLYQSLLGRPNEPAWAIHIHKPATVDPPVYDVIPPDGIMEGDVWSPMDMIHLEAFKQCLSAPLLEEDLSAQN